MDKNKQHFFNHYQKVIIVKELQDKIGEIYFWGKKTIATGVLFIIANIRIDCQIYTAEFEGLLYTILSEYPFKNQRIHMTEENDYYTISAYVSHNFVMLIGETMTCLPCHQNNRPKVLKYESFIIPLVEISSKNNNLRSIHHHKMTRLDNKCVTMNNLMQKYYEN